MSLDEYGQRKTWLLTGWKVDEPDASGEVSTHSGATQAGPTFSRSSLVAGSVKNLIPVSPAVKADSAAAQAALDVFSKYGGMSVREVKDGDNLNQDLYTELLPRLRDVAQGTWEVGHAGKNLAREMVRSLLWSFWICGPCSWRGQP